MDVFRDISTELAALLDKAEELDWSYSTWIQHDGRTLAEMETHSPAGEHFIMTIEFNKENQAETFIKDLRDYSESFDVDEHVEMWIESRGKNGVPETARELVEDAEAIDAMIKELLEALEAAGG